MPEESVTHVPFSSNKEENILSLARNVQRIDRDSLISTKPEAEVSEHLLPSSFSSQRRG